MTEPTPPKSIRAMGLRRRLGKIQISVAIGMTLVWMLLFDAFHLRPESLGLLVLGFLVSVAIMLVFPLPPIKPGFRFWPVQGVWMLVYITWKMFVASFQVTAQVFTPGTVHSSVISVKQRTGSDLMLVCTAIVTTVIPGSVIVEVGQTERELFVHVLGADTEEKVRKAEKDVRALEERLVRGLGTRADIAELEEALASGEERV